MQDNNTETALILHLVFGFMAIANEPIELGK